MAKRNAEQTPIETGTRVFTNLAYLYFTPWKEDGSEPGTTTYDLISIVGDTTSVEQAENDVAATPHEFSKDPLYENITLGARTFSCECTDFQNTVLTNLMGWIASTDGKITAAPDDYKDIYCTIEMGFNSTNDIVVLPKVKLNSRATLASMKSDVSRGTISGTCYSAYINAGSTATTALKTDMAAIAATDGEVTDYAVAADKTLAVVS